ncbi:hypothetical protein [Streptomyces sp. NPDC050504]|uniref:hypothetical protein n=1 Tax=Streptomyces sp. NPDC050504 TaxID=3365618 RepID=UPI0037B2EB62
MKKSVAALVGAFSGLALAGAALTGTAQAAEAGATATAPSCVTFEFIFVPFSAYNNYEITNGCSTTQSVKVAFEENKVDTECHSLRAGQVKAVKYVAAFTPAVKELRTC